MTMWRKKFNDSVAQFKLNGNRNIVKVSPDRKIEFWNRHKERQQYVIPDKMRAQILDISPVGHWTVWDTELLHTKTKDVKNVLYFFDCLVWESQHLLGWTYVERFGLVQARIDKFIPMQASEVKDHIYIAQNIPESGWDTAWADAKSCSYVEGLVLKRTGGSSRLALGDREDNNGGFMTRIRKYSKNMNF
jgi:ATP-dependent DNA ligase